MASTVNRKCLHCKDRFIARTADVKRGWAKFCSKSCKAKHQETRTGQYRRFLSQDKDEAASGFFSEHFSNEEHDCNKD